ncbi:catabolite control protein A [Loigolactobacillus coryniformis]|jgi:LacI family transcriptional regulator|uniref:Catabolite control protein A n=1 Tax=Loigolactobacillus coryniformis subsp. coryniformis KCTC 3167 = DSM 20001 TaxID=913848 RepID=A0A0R1F1V7_9LACO|nr:catabolite control protein A [Loigolactobacillus coryniformis]ATO55849.1 catabolite control protein A [Loigolactobacillus coryniformis subsp. coryniformis KCTC 3167 = DSM 20001]KRK14195.1 CcpA transcriptional regulator (catabolic control protein A) [Loigolactobacillus coryniformis subsp. coryniformis KCTC 3167 = DSM 20001]MCL5458435.1 catabolite control protein A [Loigolactobacillus coryniformis]OEH89093.1 catabolite control protein A [Loigolactobacillus coryniformis subsp. coryniformis]
MDKQTITIYDVAREANVSMATVSRVVNGNPNVKPATRKKVLEVIDRLDYRPNAVARGLASKKTTTVGVIIPDVTNIYFSSLARGIDDVATMYKYNIILANSDENGQKEIQVLNTLLAKQVDGVIFMGNQITDSIRTEFARSKTPIVLAGSVDPDEQVASVNIDYVEAIDEATSTLVRHGNEKIAFVTGSLNEPINGQYRLKGYKKALAQAKIAYDPNLVFETEYSYKAGEAIWDRVKAAGATAAVIGDDELAIGLLNGAGDDGVNVPDDFELITSNDSKLTEISRPKMSSITQPLYDIGAVAMRLLTKMMNKEEIDNQTILLPYGIVERGTTK